MDLTELDAGPELDDRPRPVKAPKLRYWVAGGLCLAAILYLIVGGLGSNIVYFRTVSEAVAERTADGDSRLRMAGEVVEGSLDQVGDTVQFRVTDGKIPTPEMPLVIHRGDAPELFKEGAPVVVEGRWAAVAGQQGQFTFASDRIMIKHGSEYKPPDVEQPAATTEPTPGGSTAG